MGNIALIGTHNSGKTTLFNWFKDYLKGQNYSFIEEQIRVINRKGFGINESAGDESQLALALSNSYQLLANNKNIIADRFILDNYIYAKYLNNKGVVSNKVVDLIESMIDVHLKFFDIFLYCNPFNDMVDDGIRSTDKYFQLEIDKMFKDFIYKNKYMDGKTIILRGSTEERIKFLVNREELWK